MSFARVRAIVLVGGLVVTALVFIVIALVRDTQSGTGPAGGCPSGYKLADVRLREPKDIKIKVFNATDQVGLASTVATDFKNRRFQVLGTGDEKKGFDGVALIRYGPKGVGSAQVLQAYFTNEAKPAYDPERKDDVVDVVIGDNFRQLETITGVNQALGVIGPPNPPEGTCADTGKD